MKKLFPSLLFAAGLSLWASASLAADTGGTVKGKVLSESGAIIANASISIENNSKGTTRTGQANADGEFIIRNVAVGESTLKVSSPNYSTSESTIQVSVGSAVVVTTTLKTGSIEEVVVVGTAVQGLDMAETTAGMSFDSESLKLMPVNNGFEGMVLMTPGTVDNAGEDFRGANSIGGGSSAENAYYLNGINITHIESGLGSFPMPWEAIAQTNVQTGGITAEFGGALGGVINAISKSGSNEFEFGIEYRIDPESTYEHPTSVPSNTQPGQYLAARRTNTVPNFEQSEDEYTETSIWASGPIVKDKAFFYLLLNPTKQNYSFADNSQLYERERTSDRWFVNLEWYINDNHSLGITAFDTSRERADKNYEYDVTTNTVGAQSGTNQFDDGGTFTGINYHGDLTDRVSLDVVYGITEQSELTTPSSFSPLVQDCSTGGCSNYSTHTSTSLIPKDFERTQFRADLTVDLNDHSLQFGIDQYDTDVYINQTQNGQYTNGNPNGVEDSASLGTWAWGISGAAGGSPGLRAQGYGIADGTEFVRRRVRNSYTDSTVEAMSYYLQDSWQVSNSWTLNLGFRVTDFANTITSGEKYVDQTGNFAPRIAAIWDVGAEGKQKVFMSIGRYFQPVAARMNFRQGSSQIEYYDHYAVTERDSQGRPALTGPDNSPARGNTIIDREYTQRGITDPKLIAQAGLKAMYSDQISLGYSRELDSGLTAGVRFTYNELKRSVEDTDYGPPLELVLRDLGYITPLQEIPDPDPDADPGSMIPDPNVVGDEMDEIPPFQGDFYVLTNPGSDITISYDFDNADGDAYDANGELSPSGGSTGAETITLRNDVMRVPKARRRYLAWDFTLEGQLNDRLSFDASYTWSHSYGNTEGLVKTTNNQADPGWTSDYDYADALDHAYGNLPNDRRHSIKLNGTYDVSDRFVLGFVFRAASGRPKYRFNPHPLGIDACAPNSVWSSCSSRSYLGGFYNADGTPSPRGTTGTLPWTKTIDMSFAYQNENILGGLTLKATVYNLLNDDTETDINEWEGNDDFGLSEGFTPARFLSLTARLEF